MHEDVPTKAIAACFGLAGFVVAIVCGIIVGNSAEETLSRAIPAMFVCVVVGYGIGVFTTRAISNNIQTAAAAAAAEAAETAARIVQQEAESLANSAKNAPGAKASPTTSPITTPARATNPAPTRKAAA